MKNLTKILILSMVMGAMGPTRAAGNPEDPEKLLRHVVVFKFKEDARDGQIQEVIDAFPDLEIVAEDDSADRILGQPRSARNSAQEGPGCWPLSS